MRITNIEVQDFLGIARIDAPIHERIALFAGNNGAGKSSLYEAVRMALTGESVRVSLKKDYPALIREGQKSGHVNVTVDGDSAFLSLPSGRVSPYQPPAALPYVINAQRFASLNLTERRKFLFDLMGVTIGTDGIKERLKLRGVDATRIEAIAPLLRSGFENASKEAEGKARDAKAAWRAVTNENYGSVKAAEWVAPIIDFDVTMVISAREAYDAAQKAIGDAAAAEAALVTQANNAAQSEQRLSKLRADAAVAPALKAALDQSTADLAALEQEIAAVRADASGVEPVAPMHCPHCAGAVELKEMDSKRWTLVAHEAPQGKPADPVAAARLPALEAGLRAAKAAHANTQKALTAATAAESALALGTALPAPPTAAQIADAATARAQAKAKLDGAHEGLRTVENKARESQESRRRTGDAQRFHADVVGWDLVAKSLSPDGIPAEILAEALAPLNNRLKQNALDSGWRTLTVTPDMAILADGVRRYEFLSESEKWRADAMLAEAIAHLSKLKILMLDRVDVLDMDGRAQLIEWMELLAFQGDVDTALLFATLRNVPVIVGVDCFWIDAGTTSTQLAKAA